ncbi:hypothetical protein BpHYR1_019638, partial [Brachionus plicatilis]
MVGDKWHSLNGGDKYGYVFYLKTGGPCFNINNKFNTISSSYHVNKLHMKNFNLNYNSSFDSNQDNQVAVDANLNDSFNSSFNSGHNARLNSNVSNASSAKYFNGIDGSRNMEPAPLYIICEKNQVK